MKHFIAGCALLMCALKAHGAGFQSLDIPLAGGKPMALAIWYPSAAALQTRSMGTFSQAVAEHGPIAGAGLPLVLISHGTGGYKYSHHDTALELAQAGFVVVALTHPGDNYADHSAATDVLERPGHIAAALDYMLQQWPLRASIAPKRVGLFGFSSGGFGALVSIGAQPDLRKVLAHCTANPAQFACSLLAQHGERVSRAQTATTPQMHERRIRAAVIAAPALGFVFVPAALSKVDIPIQLWRAQDDLILPHPTYSEPVRTSLARPPEYHVVAGAGHFDFLAPCTDKLAAMAPHICSSQAGFDRTAFHQRFNSELIRFFRAEL